LGDKKGIRPLKTSASKPLGMAVNICGGVQPKVASGQPPLPTSNSFGVLVCPGRTLRIGMTLKMAVKRLGVNVVS